MEENQQKTKYFVYVRKSSESDERQLQSVDNQLREIKTVADNENLEIADQFTEEKSALKPNNRPQFDEMLCRSENGEANGILCWQSSRHTRKTKESGAIQQ